MYLLWWDKHPLDIEEPTVLRGSMVREMCAPMCMRSFPGRAADGQMDLPELPRGVRYGSERRRNISKASFRPDDYYTKAKWYRLKKVVVNLAIDTYYDFMRNFRRELQQEPFTPLECRLE